MQQSRLSSEQKGPEIARTETANDDAIQSKDAVLDAATKGQATTGYETLTPWETFMKFKWCTFFAFVAAFAAGADGYQIGMNAGILANPGFVETFATKINSKGKPVLDSNIIAAWGSILPVGQFITQTTLPFLAAPMGRKVSLYVCWLCLAASILGESLSRRWEHWLVAKMLAGMGLGCLQVTLPAYISEIAPTRIRGIVLMTYNLWWTVGTFFAYLAMDVISGYDSHNWLLPIYTQWGHIGLMLIIFLVLPESAAWAVSAGKLEKGKKALRSLYRGVEDYNVDRQIEVLVLMAEHEKEVAIAQGREKWTSVFRGTDGFRTIVALWTIVSQQFTGLVLFSTYGAYFFQQAGVGDPFKIKCIILGIKLVGAISVVYFADSFGRRLISCSGTTAMWGTSFVVGFLGLATQTKAVNSAFIFLAVIWNIGLTMTGATGWGFIGEISSQRLRPYTSGAASAFNCVVNIGMNQLVPHMINANEWNWGLKAGFFYAGVGLPSVIGCWFLIPETARRSAAELDELFERKIKPYRFHKTETATQRVVALNGTDK
ncbi:MFS alpha-glucoside [Colletotrichum truncatum]|uniref:MFS alpha-glucoside n=1 Tax=Colletotrichum truncatum TaxID=5467 RepID=A0ACC3ZLH5_COLTU|nr:MFS alpha-glucoside [Colletotrichum truncatum]KAF6783930.1 MFS alpha-glucoside [Colletotrichum truncatum]